MGIYMGGLVLSIIGASLSEPHTSIVNGDFLCVYLHVYMYMYML